MYATAQQFSGSDWDAEHRQEQTLQQVLEGQKKHGSFCDCAAEPRGCSTIVLSPGSDEEALSATMAAVQAAKSSSEKALLVGSLLYQIWQQTFPKVTSACITAGSYQIPGQYHGGIIMIMSGGLRQHIFKRKAENSS